MKQLLTVILTVNLLGGTLWLGCSGEQTASTDRPVASDSTLQPDTEALGARIQLYEGSRVTTRLDADRLVKFTRVDSTVAYVLDIDIFDSAGVHTADIVGDSGIIREKTGNMSLYGNVFVETSDGTTLKTEYLYWDAQVDSIKTDSFVTLTRGEDIVRGYGLQADQRLRSTKILRQVSGSMIDPKKLEDEEK